MPSSLLVVVTRDGPPSKPCLWCHQCDSLSHSLIRPCPHTSTASSFVCACVNLQSQAVALQSRSPVQRLLSPPWRSNHRLHTFKQEWSRPAPLQPPWSRRTFSVPRPDQSSV